MIDYLARKEILHDAFFKKYAAKKYMKASILVRQWIRTEYVEEEEVNEIEPEGKGKENTPEEEYKENENDVSDEDDYMFANELEEREVDSFQAES